MAKDLSDINLSTMIFELNSLGQIDIEAIHHVCYNRELFTSFELVNGEKIFIANSVSSIVGGQGKVVLNSYKSILD